MWDFSPHAIVICQKTDVLYESKIRRTDKQFFLGWCAIAYEHHYDSGYGWEEIINQGSKNLIHNDGLSSVRINTGCTLKLYKHNDYVELLDTLTTDVHFTSAYNDQVSSVSCSCSSGIIGKL